MEENKYTSKQIATLLGVIPETVNRYIQEGKLQAVKIKGRNMISLKALKAFVSDYLEDENIYIQ